MMGVGKEEVDLSITDVDSQFCKWNADVNDNTLMTLAEGHHHVFRSDGTLFAMDQTRMDFHVTLN